MANGKIGRDRSGVGVNLLKCLFISLTCVSIYGQNAFYVQLLEQGKHAVLLGQSERGNELLEISAFGLLNYPNLLHEATVRRIFCLASLNKMDQAKTLSVKLRSWITSDSKKPIGVEQGLWDAFLLFAYHDSEPSHDLLVDDVSLSAYLSLVPDDALVWRKRLERFSPTTEQNQGDAWLTAGLAQVADDVPFLESGILWYDSTGRIDDANFIAERLLSLDQSNSLAHELKALLARRAQKQSQVKKHSVFITESRLSEKMELENQPEVQPSIDTNQPPPKLSQREIIKTLDRQLDADESNQAVRARLIAALLDAGSLRKAGRQLTVLGKADPADLSYLTLFSRFNYLTKNHEANLSLFDLAKRTPEADFYLAKSCLELGLNERAQRLINALPEDANFNKSQLQEDMSQQVSEATYSKTQTELLENLVNSGNASFIERAQLGQIYVDENEWKRAQRLVQKLVKEFPKEPRAQYLEARILLQDGRHEEASRIFSNLANAGFHDNEVFYYGGLAYYYLNNHEIAAYMFSRALKRGTQFENEINGIQAKLQSQ